MGFALHVNFILRQDPTEGLVVGKEYNFEKSELCVVTDDIQIWLTKKDWTPLADIQVVSQARAGGKTTGKYVVKYLYTGEEQEKLKQIFTRMYGWQ